MSNELIAQELMVAKGHAFDLYMETQNLRRVNKHQQHVLFMIAHKLGVVDMNSLSIDEIPLLLDEKLRELNVPE